MTPTKKDDKVDDDHVDLWGREESPKLSITVDSLQSQIHLLQYGSNDHRWGIHSCLWDGGIGMLCYLREHQMADAALVIDLGAGTGIVGLGMGFRLGYQHVVLTDLPDAIPLLQENVQLNQDIIIENGGKVVEVGVEELTWGEPCLPKALTSRILQCSRKSDPHCVYMIGADIIYRQTLFRPLLDTMVLIWKLNDYCHCKCLFATQSTRQHLDEFYDLARREYNMDITFLANVTVPEGCSSCLESYVELSSVPKRGKDIINILEIEYKP